MCVCESTLFFYFFQMQIWACFINIEHIYDVKSWWRVLGSPLSNIPPPGLVYKDFQHVAPEGEEEEDEEEEGRASRHSLHKHRNTAEVKRR